MTDQKIIDKQFIATKAFIEHNGKVLILRESSDYDDGVQTGKFDVPGGRMNPESGQTHIESLKREIHEETGLEVTIKKVFRVIDFFVNPKGEKWHIVCIFFICETQSNDVRLSIDHDHFEWINPQDYEKFPVIENLKDVFKAYLQEKI